MISTSEALLIAEAGAAQLAGRGTKERTPTRIVRFWPGKFYLEKYVL